MRFESFGDAAVVRDGTENSKTIIASKWHGDAIGRIAKELNRLQILRTSMVQLPSSKMTGTINQTSPPPHHHIVAPHRDAIFGTGD